MSEILYISFTRYIWSQTEYYGVHPPLFLLILKDEAYFDSRCWCTELLLFLIPLALQKFIRNLLPLNNLSPGDPITSTIFWSRRRHHVIVFFHPWKLHTLAQQRTVKPPLHDAWIRYGGISPSDKVSHIFHHTTYNKNNSIYFPKINQFIDNLWYKQN